MSAIPPEGKKLLAHLPAFDGLDRDALHAISQVAIWRDYAAGQVVFLEGEPCFGLYVVQRGWLRAVKTSTSGREQVFRFVGPGETFNEIGVFAGGPNWVTVEALEDSRLWIIPRAALLDLLDQHHSLSRLIIENMAKRVVHLVGLVENLSLRSVEERVARTLLEKSTGDIFQRQRWSTQAAMAAHLGTVPDVFNRALRGLAEQGLIEIDRQQITILDRPGLEARANQSE